MVINVIAVTYEIFKEHARVCQSAPCMFYCIRLSFFLKMYKFDFFPDLQIYVDMLLFVPVFHAAAQLHFPFFLRGDWGTPQQAGLCTLYSYNVHQSPACSFLVTPFWSNPLIRNQDENKRDQN